ncbi:hypothetical protein LC20004_13410 [Loigolactobacillus coryniformis subsp. torquens DSM 20004 = KCTC 3535]|uniref:Uncharacterized protein n=1 Tax=Loigolactobacillus coryniformis subsp. torquens DSM 20004 = KCTC 3535 TaxID=1423822 RepID=A0A2D1KRV8_9LACO|nr:hypothetical protein [Loigolactobacillus coryniformis]ATO44831.1 hypothetical protein LC20004_13410 [Loigolactobacillus coryniformis subsp. torquens DSM 20004 = KCTC 3535]
MLQRFFFSRIAFFISCGFFSGNFFREGLNCGPVLTKLVLIDLRDKMRLFLDLCNLIIDFSFIRINCRLINGFGMR